VKDAIIDGWVTSGLINRSKLHNVSKQIKLEKLTFQTKKESSVTYGAATFRPADFVTHTYTHVHYDGVIIIDGRAHELRSF